MCGEHDRAGRARHRQPGSSPRVRGTLLDDAAFGAWKGIIPACAGNTSTGGESTECPRDHPRVCGEHRLMPPLASSRPGSSPRVRGTLWEDSQGIECKGIIPACAGNTSAGSGCPGWPGDHPRVCGEHYRFVYWPNTTSGSSPRVRGTRRPLAKCGYAMGIIPACAGNTFSSVSNPRAIRGSSPRVRGTHWLERGRIVVVGIIPACAGNTDRRIARRF